MFLSDRPIRFGGIMFDWTIDTPVKQIIQEAVGAGSMCWEHPERAGVFKTHVALTIADEVMAILNQKQFGRELFG
jgi:hypothetical protein